MLQSQAAKKPAQMGHIVYLNAGVHEQRCTANHETQEGEVEHALAEPTNLFRRNRKQFRLQQQDKDTGDTKDRTGGAGPNDLGMNSGAQQVPAIPVST